MGNNSSFLSIDEISEANKDKLLSIRKTLLASLASSAKEGSKKYNISLVIFLEFEKLTHHITNSYILKN